MTSIVLVMAMVAASPSPTPKVDTWTPVLPFVGEWRGTAEGEPGKGKVEREYRFVLKDRFIHERNVSTYFNDDGSVKERHEHWSFISYDKARKLFVLRQFHQEGFVNTYAEKPELRSPSKLVFESEGFENLPSGWKARETYELAADKIVEVFELAEPGKEYHVYSKTVLTRGHQ